MPIQPVSSSIQSVSTSSFASRSAEEATETTAQRRIEAANGDRREIARFAATPAPNPPGTGTVVNLKA